jgi:hypothetical protein
MPPSKVADRATVNVNTSLSNADFALTGLTIGNLLIIRTAADNSGSAGVARTITVTNQSGTPIDTATDVAFQQNNDPGAASAGVTCNVILAQITATSGTVRVTYSGTVVQAGVAEEWSGLKPVAAVVVGTPVGANGTTTALAVLAEASAAADNLVYAVEAVEGPSGDTYTQDSDTTGGAWTSLTKAGTTNATADTNQTTYGGYKVTSVTGAQNYAPTINNARDSAGLILELAAPAVVTGTVAVSVGINLAATGTVVKVGTATITVGASIAVTGTVVRTGTAAIAVGVSVAASGTIPACTDVLREPFDNLTAWTTSGSPTIVSGRTGSAVSVSDASTVTYAIAAPAQSHYITVGFAFRCTSRSAQSEIVRLLISGTWENRLTLNTNGSVSFYQPDGLLTTSATDLVVADTWYYVELQYRHANAPNGTVIARINGSNILNSGGIDTLSAIATPNQLQFNSTTGITHLYDDVYLSTGVDCLFRGSITVPSVTTVIGQWNGLDVIGMQWGAQEVVGAWWGSDVVFPEEVAAPVVTGTGTINVGVSITATGTPISPPTLVGTSTLQTSGSGSRTVTPHASTATGDLLLVIGVAGVSTANTILPPVSGWTTLLAATTTGTMNTGVYAHIRAGGETTYTFPIGITSNSTHVCVTVSNWVDSIGSLVTGTAGTRAGSGGTFTTTAPTISTATSANLVLCLAGERTTATETGISSVGNGFTEQLWVGHGAGGIESVWVGWKKPGAAGAVGAVSVVYPNTQASNGIALLIAVPP